MKYQQLDNLEAGWKWSYLVKKYQEGEQISRHLDSSDNEAAVALLLRLEHQPTQVIEWIDNHMAKGLEVKLKQAIRAKRKRYYNAEQEHTKKKSIDLDFLVWRKLADQAKLLDATLSDTIEYLLCEHRALETMPQTLAAETLEKLNQQSAKLNLSVSETVNYLLSLESRSSESKKQINALKQDLNDLLDL